MITTCFDFNQGLIQYRFVHKPLWVTLINSLLRINQVGALQAPHIFPAFHARKMVVHPCTTKEGLMYQTFLRTRTLLPIHSEITNSAIADVSRYLSACVKALSR